MDPYHSEGAVTLYHGSAGDVLASLPAGSVNCIVTSPPYFGLRNYGVEGQLGMELQPNDFISALVAVLREARRVLADDGTLWLNLGDSYSTYPANRGASTGIEAKRKRDPRPRVPKGAGLSGDRPVNNMLGIPWRVALALQDDGWTLRNEIIWHKPNAMPESVRTRLAGVHEHLFMLSKKPRYWFDQAALHEPGTRKPGDVWSINTRPFRGYHDAVFPPAIPERCILAGCRPGGTVLDPFSGSGTTGLAALAHGRKYIGIDLNAEYLDLSISTRLATGRTP
jgi:DNA modification methylase